MTTTHQVRQAENGNSHLAHDDGTLVCGTKARTFRVTPAAGAEAYVTCGKCRRAAGWDVLPGSYRSRITSGLDSSAWGANKGR